MCTASTNGSSKNTPTRFKKNQPKSLLQSLQKTNHPLMTIEFPTSNPIVFGSHCHELRGSPSSHHVASHFADSDLPLAIAGAQRKSRFHHGKKILSSSRSLL